MKIYSKKEYNNFMLNRATKSMFKISNDITNDIAYNYNWLDLTGYFRVDNQSISNFYQNNMYLFSLEFENKNLYNTDEEVKKLMLFYK